MTGDPAPRRGPADASAAELMQVPSVRLDELAALRAEVERLRADRAPAAHRVDRVGRWERIREDDVQPLRASATDARRTAAADLIVAAKGLSVVGLLVAGAVALAVVLTVLYGLWRLAARFAAWSSNGSALLGGLVLIAASVAIVGTGLWLFLRLSDRRRTDR